MSAFFLAVNRDRSDFSKEVAKRMHSMLQHFGSDGQQLVVQEHYALGYQRHWTVPEEMGEKQPLRIGDAHWFMFCGRVDNREALFAELQIQASEQISDANLMQQYFDRFGEPHLSRVIGPFVFVVFDPKADTVVAARDGMGGRGLVYSVTEKMILIATYEMAIVAHGSVAYDINNEKAARFLTNQMEAVPSSFINGIQPLNPGTLLSVSKNRSEARRFYQPDSKRRIKFSSDEEYAQEFKRLLSQAVKRRMRSVSKVGSMLSGGMDSVPISILAAQQSNVVEQQLTAFSWVYDKYPDQDERHYSAPICDKFDIDQVEINADYIWPTLEDHTIANPILPFSSPYMEQHAESFRQAQQRDVKVILTGLHGDLLYLYTENFFYEFLGAGQFGLAFSEFASRWSRRISAKDFVKTYLLKPLSVVQTINRWRRKNRPQQTHVLQPEMARLLTEKAHWLKYESRHAIRPRQWQVVLDGFAGEDAEFGRYHEAHFGIERRYPFRDRDLCEFMLAVPSHQLYFANVHRAIVKNAFKEEFTEALFTRNSKTRFNQVIAQGIEKDQKMRNWFQNKPTEWTLFVKKGYFNDETQQKISRDLVSWRCGYYHYWKSVCYTPVARLLG